MIYKIPDSKLKKLEKQCNRIRNKGANVTFQIGPKCTITASNNDKLVVPAHEVEVEGFYSINGWDFVATIEHGENGNIVRCIRNDLESSIPEKYKNAPAECEHCHRIRTRKDTYLLYNENNDDWKQVGKTCLKEYTGGLDAEVCAQINSFFSECENDSNFDADIDNYGWDSDNWIDNNYFKKCAYPIVKKLGYKKDATVEAALDALLGRGVYYNGQEEPEYATDEEIKMVDEWVNSEIDDEQFGYFRNAKLAWQKGFVEYRDLPLVASLIGTYFKNKAQKATEYQNSINTKYVGNVGDKITIDIKNARVLYIKDNSNISYYAIPSRVYEIIDTEGNTYICASTVDLLDAAKISATIKGYKDYRGTKQTVLVRPKIIETKNNSTEHQTTGEAVKALDKFIDDLDN